MRTQGTLLAAFAHPDVEALGPAGTPAFYAQQGVAVRCCGRAYDPRRFRRDHDIDRKAAPSAALSVTARIDA